MLDTVIKVLLTSVLVVAIAETAKRSTAVGALVASLPLTSLLALIWLYRDTGDAGRTAALASSIFWYVLPSLVFFIAFPAAVRFEFGFWLSLLVASALTVVAYFAMLAALKGWGIEL